MNLRTAKKIMNHVGTTRDGRYTKTQKERALARYERSRTAKEAQCFWNCLMRALGPSGRAKIAATHDAGKALDILMRNPESEWEGDPTAMTYKEPK